ncbi:sodium/sugar symporter [Roseivirga pacifica]|uniref:sodium/sugar symporter n=1 Tax=Roseivirga pacifica TaxID=1267423 RepID=UPI0020941649|nr:sodium/sugar symporter [Roseivirga pacifica]MCO6359548.1 sodium/solute symporter [Roseivirga pacifica]MCO6366918.1 sodium/solute symporter [Roseivirga pacifica]MCO6370550.1 sodium/solute symporter [Roseivirga pacifica]MCO6374575.1 sodium/solute symporter [Roseivirga pacifica]MCO6379833.1 sodium/solute symporter [Roseivirga pacifica]
MNFSTTDIIVFIVYGVMIVTFGLWISREKKGHKKDSADYFLAGKALPWWAIGASLIASNISAEQFIGMSGSGYAIGLGIASYEWMGGLTLILVAKYLLPIFIEKQIFTLPQFLEIRYDSRIRTILAVFWVFLYTLVNLTTVLYLSSLALSLVLGISMTQSIVGLAVVAVAYSIYGGLKAVAWTDVIQVVFLVIGGLITTYLALDAVSAGAGPAAGFKVLLEKAPEKFDMILSKDNEFYKDLPGLGVILGGLWIANISYFGCNQYIIQRALAAKNIGEAQKGLAFAGYLKLLLPIIVVIPGIAAFVLQADIARYDEAYPWLLGNLVPVGIKGMAFAALIAAALSSLSSMMNSTATIFTMDIYKPFVNPEASETKLVTVGRIVGLTAVVIAVLVAQPLLGGEEQVFQFIQKYTGYVSPGIVVLFLFGLFWKRTTATGALWAAIASVPFSVVVDLAFPSMPFLNQMGVVFLALSALIIAISFATSQGDSPKAIKIGPSLFKTSPTFNALAMGIILILGALYAMFW